MAVGNNEIPSTPEECPICKRVEQTVMECPILKNRLSETELADVVRNLQSAVLNKEVKKTERGINMADEKYVISKASFEDFYETQDTLVSIMEKMVDRIEKQDQVIMKFGAALTEVLSKDFGMPEEMPPVVDEAADVMEEEVPVEDEEVEEEVELDEEGNPIVEEESEEVVEGEEKPVEPVLGAAPPMMEESFKAEKAAFEAGYKAALAEMQKKNGTEVKPLEVPAQAATRPVVPATTPVAKTGDLNSLPEKELANMTPNQINTWLREHKLYR